MSIFPESNALSLPIDRLRLTEDKANLEQMFLLIEGILPFEACLYYQVLPLSIEGSSLNLGMVNPDDVTAADYVRRLVSYINCSIVSRPISSDWHRSILSKFLSHSAKSRQSSQSSKPRANSTPSSFEEQPTLVVNAPSEIIEKPHGSIAESTTTSPQPSKSDTAPPADADKIAAPPADPPANAAAKIDTAPLRVELEKDGPVAPAAPPHVSNHQISETSPDVSDNLSQLNPKELTQLLLKRIITQEGIGRLYLERQSPICRILWSKDGVVQSVVDDIPPQLLQGVINELKRMMSLSLIPVRKPKQIEIERIHNQKRILLRLRVMPGDHGEEATLQVLRGAALKFYQQQQIDTLGRDALSIARDLQQRIGELRTQAQRNLDPQDPQQTPLPTDTKQKTLPAIIDMLQQMEQQLNDMLESPD